MTRSDPTSARPERIESGLLRRINERRLFEALQQHGPASRAALTRLSGLTAPTVSKAVESLLSRGFVEEINPLAQTVGRPGKLVRLATESAVVLGVVIDVESCSVALTGLDGRVTESLTRRFATPSSYPVLLDSIEAEVRAAVGDSFDHLRGIGVSVPGLVNDRLGEIVFSPNLHLLDKRNPARDLSDRLGCECLLLQESYALCLGERLHGAAQGLDDFALLDVEAGLGLGVMSGGRLLAGHSGLAGELGHITVAPDGLRCGCGNRGCLETLATDAALARMLSEAVGRPVDLATAAALLAERPADFQHELRTVTEHLAIAIAAVINIFNPTALFVHGQLLVGNPERFERILDRVRQRTLTASLADCAIHATRSSKRQGAVAGIIHQFTNAWAPSLS
jgi:predicted NBD/HSP70 family sugar kinase